MKVRITCGTYGHRPDMNEPRIVRKDNTSLPFELEDTEARRIIELGIAERCEDDGYRSLAGDISTEYQDVEKEIQMDAAENVMSMGYIDMKKLAKKLGVDAKGTKEELRERLGIVLGSIKTTENDPGNLVDTENNDSSNERHTVDDNEQNMDQDAKCEEQPPFLEAQVPV